MNIVLADIEQALKTAVEKISEHGVKTLGVKTDVMQKNEVEHLFNESIKKLFDKVHFLCNNAGVASTVLADGIWELDDKDWEWVLGVNFYGTLYGLQSFVPHDQTQRRRACVEYNIVSRDSSWRGNLYA